MTKPLAIIAAYTLVVAVAAALLIRTIGVNCYAAEAPVATLPSRAALSCDQLTHALSDELWAWYMNDVQGLGPQAHAREPMPGALREWESARHEGEQRCAADADAVARFGHLLALRRTLEANAYLLSQTAGADIAALRHSDTARAQPSH